MFFTNIDLKPKTLKILATILIITGIVFIFTSDYIGYLAIRIASVITAIILAINLKMTYYYIGKIKKIFYILSFAALVVIMFMPGLVLLVGGFILLYFSIAEIYDIFKMYHVSNKLRFLPAIAGIIFAIFCILNSKGTIAFIIRLIGALMLMGGCFNVYLYMCKTKNIDNYFFGDDDEN